MNSQVFIKGCGVISPQNTFDGEFADTDFIHYPNNRYHCIEPEYSNFIDAKQIRRMSRVIKMGVVSSMQALKNSNIIKPEAVIVGTAFGCLEDTYSFLSKLVQYKEDMLSPTAFIHSTHNTIASQIALHYKCYGYNSTYVHRSTSFDAALNDALMLLKENAVKNVLVGGIDEVVNASYTIMNRMGHFRKDEIKSYEHFYGGDASGSVAGEGSAFFALVNEYENDCLAKISGVESGVYASSSKAISMGKAFLKANGIDKPQLILAGFNGDKKEDAFTSEVVGALGNDSNLIHYKHLCGEYGTASAFATYMGATMLNKNLIPGRDRFIKNKGLPLKNILIYNHLHGSHHSMILLEAC